MESLLGFILFAALLGYGSTIPTHLSRSCTYEDDVKECRHNVYCNELVDISLYQNLRRIGYDCHSIVSYRGNVFDKIYLTVKNFIPLNPDDPHTFLLADMEGSANIVYYLDFSGNEYTSVPSLTIMSNLHILNFSNNALTEAKLSNRFQLELLTEIDYSYNTINEITVDHEEFSYRKLKKINLSHNYLVAIQEAVFDSFTELESLDLSFNFIDSLSILTFEGTKNLLRLNLKHNRLSQLNSALLRFSKLVELDLSENKFENIRFGDFEKLTNLVKLDLSYNLIVNVDKNVFMYMVFLQNLDLSTNLLESIEKDTLENLSNLVHVDLSKNKFKKLPKGLFPNKGISEFSIKDNNLEGPLVRGNFEGLNLVTELDLSNQQLTSIEDFAFYGLDSLTTILLNNNRLSMLSKKSFTSLRKLEILDLSNNQLSNIEFEKEDLISLQSLLLQKNSILAIKHEYFTDLNMLQFLDLSNNRISKLDTDSFNSLRQLINFQISNNPISGTLEESTFRGLNSLPSLDISNTLLTLVKNSSFDGMNQLKILNISQSKITELQFNSFLHTGQIETLDLSFNELKDFVVNTTELVNLQNLFLNNNSFVTISPAFFKGLTRLMKIILSHNKIQVIHDKAFQDQTDLRYLDISYNEDIKLNVSQFEKTPNLHDLLLSAVRTNVTFKQVQDIRLSHLEISFSKIQNVSVLDLKQLRNLDDLVLTNNNISQIEVGSFNGVNNLRKLDLSFNKISYIQPGAFKDNVLLSLLNISHNHLKTVSYGIFRGLMYLDTIDMSYNEILDLQTERFYEVRSLSVLIADYNKINTVNADEFAGTGLSKLSIGDNPIPCHILVNLKRSSISFVITAINLDESRDENVDGITCNMDHYNKPKDDLGKVMGNEKVLYDIKDILLNLTSKDHHNFVDSTNDDSNKYPSNVTQLTNQILQLSSNFSQTINKSSYMLDKISSTFLQSNNNTNTLLDKIYKVLTSISTARRSNAIPPPKENVTSESIIPYINKMKQDLEDTIAIEKQNILTEVEMKIKESLSISLKDSVLLSATHEAYSNDGSSDAKSFIFIEVCVGLILVILILFALYKFYNSGMFVPSRHSSSTRHLSDALENSAL